MGFQGVLWGFVAGCALTQRTPGQPLALPQSVWACVGELATPPSMHARAQAHRMITGAPRFVAGLAPKKAATERGFSLVIRPGVTLEGAFDIVGAPAGENFRLEKMTT